MRDSIPASFLKLNLKPLAFRLLCHFYVWGKCFQSVPTLAILCRADPKTVKASIDELVERDLIIRSRRRRQTSEYTLNLKNTENGVSKNSRTVEKPFSTEDQSTPSSTGVYRSDPQPKTVFQEQEPPKTVKQEAPETPKTVVQGNGSARSADEILRGLAAREKFLAAMKEEGLWG